MLYLKSLQVKQEQENRSTSCPLPYEGYSNRIFSRYKTLRFSLQPSFAWFLYEDHRISNLKLHHNNLEDL